MVSVIFSLGLIVGYILRRSVHEYIVAPKRCPFATLDAYSADVSDAVRRHISAASLQSSLRSVLSPDSQYSHDSLVSTRSSCGENKLDQAFK